MIQLIPKEKYLLMPWKNGKGTTSQIQIWPPESSFVDSSFVWRLSSAAMSEDGDFSVFSGYERLLFLISGAGLKVGERSLTQIGQAISFSGDKLVAGKLAHGAILDLNLIYRPDLAAVEHSLVKTAEVSSVAKPRSQVIFFNLNQALPVKIAEVTYVLQIGDTLIIDNTNSTEAIEINFAYKPEAVLVIRIDVVSRLPL